MLAKLLTSPFAENSLRHQIKCQCEREVGEKEVEIELNSANIKKYVERFVMRRCHVVNSPSNYIQFHLFSAWINFPIFALHLPHTTGCCSGDAEAPHQITSTGRFASLPADSAMPLLFDSTLSSARICLRFVVGFWCLENGFAINQASKFRANKWIHNLIISSDVRASCWRWFLCKTPIN